MRFLALSCSAIAGLTALPALAQPYPQPTPLPPPPGYAAPGTAAPGYAAPGYAAPGYAAPAPAPAYPPPAGYAAPAPAYAPGAYGAPAPYPPPASYGGQVPAYPPPPPPPAGYGTTAPPAPAYGAAPTAPQGVPAGSDTANAVRPGHAPGVGLSYPLSGSASNIGPTDTRSLIAPTLPTPALGPNAGPAQYLQAARASLAAGRTGEAQQSLEMAQTRLLDRSVPYNATDRPSANPAVEQISEALRALGAGDRMQAMRIIDATIPQAAAGSVR